MSEAVDQQEEPLLSDQIDAMRDMLDKEFEKYKKEQEEKLETSAKQVAHIMKAIYDAYRSEGFSRRQSFYMAAKSMDVFGGLLNAKQ